MAKKSKKKSVKKATRFIPFVLLILGIVVVCMGFLAGATYTPQYGDPSSITIWKLAVGGSIDDLSLNLGGLASQKTSITFAILPFLCLIVPLAGAVVSVFLKGKIGGLIATICFLFAGIAFFFVPQVSFVESVTEILGSSSKTTTAFSAMDYTLGVGSIIGGVVSLVGGLISGAYTVIVK